MDDPILNSRQGSADSTGVDLHAILKMAVERGASDVHLKVGQPPVVRFDGELERLDGWPVMSSEMLEDVLAEIGARTPARLAAFEQTPSMGEPADLHDQVCARHVVQAEGAGNEPSGDNAAPSALVPRFVLMDPVPVFTGHADPLPGSAPVKAASAAGNIPMPRLRPVAPAPVPQVQP